MFRMSKPGLPGIMTSRDLPSFNLSDVFTIQSSVRPMSHVTSKYDHELTRSDCVIKKALFVRKQIEIHSETFYGFSV